MQERACEGEVGPGKRTPDVIPGPRPSRRLRTYVMSRNDRPGPMTLCPRWPHYEQRNGRPITKISSGLALRLYEY